jgi:hypothetical protein
MQGDYPHFKTTYVQEELVEYFLLNPTEHALVDTCHGNAIERKLFAMKGFHHPGGSQQAFLTGLAHLYNLVSYPALVTTSWVIVSFGEQERSWAGTRYNKR